MSHVIIGNAPIPNDNPWLTEHRRFDAPLIALVKVYLKSPSTKTLYLSSNFVETPDLQEWEGAITELDPINAPGSHLGPGPDPCTAGFSLASRAALGFQTGETNNVTNLFKDYRWLGAKVEIYTWSQRMTSRSPELVYTGIVQSYKVGPERCDVHCIQRQDANRILSPTFVTRDKYPRAPEKSVGLPLPIVYGKVGLPMRPPWPATSVVRDLERVNGGQLGIPAVIVDTGRGGSNQKQRMLIASHAIKAHSDSSAGLTYYLRSDDLLVPLAPSALVNASDGAGFDVADDFNGANYPITPTDTWGYTTGVTNPRYALDLFDEVSYAEIVTTGSPGANWTLYYRLPSVPEPGTLVEAFAILGYDWTNTDAGVAYFQFYLYALTFGAASIITSAALTPGTNQIKRMSIGTAWAAGALPSQPWAFNECTLGVYIDNTTFPPSGPNNRLRVRWLGIEVQYKPMAKVWRAAQFSQPKFRRGIGPRLIDFMGPREVVSADTEIEGEFYGTIEGITDDSGGTYTGVASALVERPCDVGHHLLRNYGGQDSTQVNALSSTFGSFLEARTALKTWRQTDWKAALIVAEASDVETQIRRIAEAGLLWIYLDRFTDKWHCVPWLRGGGTDYGRKVYRDDLIQFEIDAIPSGRVPSGVRIPYGWDGATRQFLLSTHVSRVASRSGYLYQNVRDQYLSVVAGVNDKLDMDVAGTPYNQTLAAADYTDATLLTEIQKINLLVNPVSVAFGGRIVTGVNDRIHFNDGAGKIAILVAGLYSMEGLAAQVATQMNAVSTNWSCSYSRTTRKFTISRSSGTAQLTFGANTETSAALGFYNDAHTAGSPYVSDFAVEEELISYSASFAFSLKFATGANGTEQAAPKTCAGLLGFDGRVDTDALKYAQAVSPKGILERTLDQAAAAYGQTREVVIEGRALYDTDTARELRNRLVDWLKEPRLIIRWRTTRMPDLHRGELVRFDDFDNFGISYPKQGSDGLWAGKRFRVLSMQQRLGPDFTQEIEAIEND